MSQCRDTKCELLLALAERIDQVLWCLLTASDPTCREAARTEAITKAQKFAREAETPLHGTDDVCGDRDFHELLVAVNESVFELHEGLMHGATEFIAGVRSKMPDATDLEILAAVRYGGALEMREIDQVSRYRTALGESVDENLTESIGVWLVEPYIFAVTMLEQHFDNPFAALVPGPKT